MTEALRALLLDCIEYAGMFPPAKLPFQQAFDNYVKYQIEKESWILSRLICPIHELSSLQNQVEQNSLNVLPIRISVLLNANNSGMANATQVLDELRTIISFTQEVYPNIMVETAEAKLSEEFVRFIINDIRHDPLSSDLTPFAESIIQSVSEQQHPLHHIFFELPFNGTSISISVFKQMLLELDKINYFLNHHGFSTRIGIKVRCGGLNSILPTLAMSEVILECAKLNVPFKATAGLHYPFFDIKRNEKYGFISLFSACAYAYSFPNETLDVIQAILTENEPQNFLFDDEGWVWKKQHFLTCEQISTSRKLFQSFGSCSFEEPIQELKRLKWLD
ncbi:MAG: hypothetical protein N2450_00720 [bacterium]|nr:hypothetical protein [bacterium]